MKRFNKNSRKQFLKMTALTLAIVTAMSVAKPCEVMAASSTSGRMTFNGKQIIMSLKGSSSHVGASTVYSGSGIVLWISLTGTMYSLTNPLENPSQITSLPAWNSAPNTAAANVYSQSGYVFKSAQSRHGASLYADGCNNWSPLSITY